MDGAESKLRVARLQGPVEPVHGGVLGIADGEGLYDLRDHQPPQGGLVVAAHGGIERFYRHEEDLLIFLLSPCCQRGKTWYNTFRKSQMHERGTEL